MLWSCGSVTAAVRQGFDLRGRGWHTPPTHPPRMHRAQAIDQHRAGSAFDPHACFAMYRGEREASGQKSVGGRFAADPAITLRDCEGQSLIGVIPILPRDLR